MKCMLLSALLSSSSHGIGSSDFSPNSCKRPPLRAERVAADFIASMCDKYFISFYNKYIGELQLPLLNITSSVTLRIMS